MDEVRIYKREKSRACVCVEIEREEKERFSGR